MTMQKITTFFSRSFYFCRAGVGAAKKGAIVGDSVAVTGAICIALLKGFIATKDSTLKLF
jgi:hypothetical protein